MGVVITPHPHPMDPYIPPFRPAPIMRVYVCHRDTEEVAFLQAFKEAPGLYASLWGNSEIRIPFTLASQVLLRWSSGDVFSEGPETLLIRLLKE